MNNWEKLTECISCLEVKYEYIMTEIDKGVFICDDCLQKVEQLSEEVNHGN